MVPDERMAELVRGYPKDLRGAGQALIDAANEAGGQDNITCVLVQWFAG
jgi:protein phosphatase